MKAAVLRQPGELHMEERTWPAAQPGWVVIAVEAAGICGTDVAVYQGRHPARLPVVLGHEFAGRVAAVGEGVTGLAVGQTVMAEGSWLGSTGVPPRAALGRTVDGCFAEAVAVPATAVHRLPAGLEALVAQSATTLATAVHAVERAGPLAGRRVAIIGPGHAGLLLLQVVGLQAPAEVVVLGTRPERLALARQLGAGAVVSVTAEAPAGQVLPQHHDFDLVFEAAGTPSALELAFGLCRSEGTVVCYGIIDQTLDGVSGYPLYAKELNVLGSRGAAGSYEAALRLLAEGQVQVLPLITHRVPLGRTSQALALATDRSSTALRVVVLPGDGRLPNRHSPPRGQEHAGPQ